MANQIVIDGNNFTDATLAGLSEIELEYGLFDNAFTFGASSTITLSKDGFDFIESKFFNSCADVKNSCDVAYYKECCDLWLDLDINFSDVEICPYDCRAYITLSKTSPYKTCYDYLCKTLIGQDGYRDVATLHKVNYAVNGGFIQRFLFIFLPIFSLVLYAITLIMNALIAICQVIEFLVNAVLNIANTLTFGLVDAFIGLFSNPNKFEILGTNLDNLSSSDLQSQTCESIIQSTVYDGNPLALTQSEITTICTTDDRSTCLAVLINSISTFDLGDAVQYCDFIIAFKSGEIITGTPNTDGICPDIIPFDSFACSLSEYVAGVGNFHAGIKLKEVFEYYARKCGLEFKSGIFNDPNYANMGILLSLNTEGQNGTDVEWIQENVPTKPIKQLLDDLGENVFNAKWIIKDGCLYFDRKDIIDGLRDELFSLEEIEDRLVKKPCISYIEDAAPAFLDFSYCSDSLNSAGRSQSRKFSGNVEWNASRNKNVGDPRVVQSSCFSAEQRFMFDTKWQRQSGAIQWDKIWDKFRCGDYLGSLNGLTGALSALFNGGFFTIIADILVCDVKRKCDLILSGDVTQCMPLLIFDPNSPLDDTTVIKRQVDVIDGYSVYEYNYPLSMVCQLQDDSFATQMLYDNYWFTEDPNLKGREVFQLTELEWVFNCDELRQIHNSDCGWYIDTPYGRANVDLIKFDCKEGEESKAIVELGTIRCY